MSTILVVDDEPSIAESIAEILSGEGYDVRMAPNGRAALEALESGDVGLVLLDHMMPLMDGGQLLAEMDVRGHLGRIPVVMVTAVPEHLLPGPKRWCAYLGKPFELDDLLALVARHLTRTGH